MNVCARVRLLTDWVGERFCFQGLAESGTFSFNTDAAVFENLRALCKALDASFFFAAEA
jgi:hypothetical protein